MGRKITMNGQFLEGGERSIFPHPAEVFNSITPKTREIKCELQIIAVDICRRMWYDNRAKQVEYCWASVVLQIGVLYPFLMLTFLNLAKTLIPWSGYVEYTLSFYFNLFGDNRSCVFRCGDFGCRTFYLYLKEGTQMALFRCAACGSPNVVTDQEDNGIQFDYVKGGNWHRCAWRRRCCCRYFQQV